MFVENLPGDLQNYPVVIFGSGPAGYAVAARLAERRISSLVIEAGSEEDNARLQTGLADHEGHGHLDGADWRKHSIIGLGGGSRIWSGWITDLERRDFADWPVSYDEVAAHYPDALKLVGPRDPVILGYRKPWLNTFEHKPVSLPAKENLLRILDRAGALRASDFIHVAQNKILRRLEIAPGENRVSGFSLTDARDGAAADFHVPARANIVLALGGIGGAQMLLQPGADGAPSMFARKGIAGRYLMEHPEFTATKNSLLLDGERAPLPPPPPKFGNAYSLFLSSDSLWERAGKIGVWIHPLESPLSHAPAPARALARKLRAPKFYGIYLRSEKRAESSNRIRLAGKNAFGVHTAVVRYVMGAHDWAAIDFSLQELARELGRKNAGFVRIDNDTIYNSKIIAQGHIMGATRMGENPADSVVDANARVHELENLYIAGSGVFRSGGTANPTLTIVALARRLADHLAEAAGG